MGAISKNHDDYPDIKYEQLNDMDSHSDPERQNEDNSEPAQNEPTERPWRWGHIVWALLWCAPSNTSLPWHVWIYAWVLRAALLAVCIAILWTVFICLQILYLLSRRLWQEE